MVFKLNLARCTSLGVAPTNNRLRWVAVILVTFASWLNCGCAADGPPSVWLSSERSTAREIWRIDANAAGYAASLALHPDGKHFAVGSGAGVVSYWALGAKTPEKTYPTRWNWVSSVSISPDGNLLAWASLDQPDRFTGSKSQTEAVVQVCNLRTGAIVEKAFQQTENCSLRFSPDSRFLAVQVDVGFAIVDAGSLNVVLSGAAGGPPLFFTRADGVLQVIAGSFLWELEDSKATLTQNFFSVDAPLAIAPDGSRAFVGLPVTWANERWIDPSLVLEAGGILDGSLDQKSICEFLKFSGRRDWWSRQLAYIPDPGNPKGGRLIAWLEGGGDGEKRDVVSIDLSAKRYQSLIPLDWPKGNGTQYAMAVSRDGRCVGVGGDAGVVILALETIRKLP
jgi:hypothetical protein